MEGRQVALLRGINVGKAKRVAMADLRDVVTELGFGHAKTLLNSGNIVYTAPGVRTNDAAERIEKGVRAKTGVSSRVTVLTAKELAEAIDDNPLAEAGENPSHFLVAVLRDPADRAKLKAMTREDWGRDAFALGRRVAYLWCAGGVLKKPPPRCPGPRRRRRPDDAQLGHDAQAPRPRGKHRIAPRAAHPGTGPATGSRHPHASRAAGSAETRF